ncbi:uncharacterized protein LOC123310950 [Coccinella septempunctata]|uniref:uncharacterized protein LOC123310950 n=1 Tax=Coccinella septempunctata TaxID=41139 RepID=UPI001D099EA1|nr:uncharacterized protein LOC123310950 [Coccinella septempunctata]
MVDIISENHCRNILLQQNPSFSFKSFDVKPLVQESLGGLMGLHYILRISYMHNAVLHTLQLFVKTLNNQNKIMYKISRELLFYEKEALFFMKLIPEYEKNGINVAFAPNAYFCGDYAIVLEDLTVSGFKLFPKEEPMDIEHCYACLATLAEFHASSMIYEISKSKSMGTKYSLLEDQADVLKDLIFSGGDTYGDKYVQESVRALLALAELEFDDSSSLETLKNVFSSTEPTGYGDLCCVLLHGDLWSNNFLHKYDGKEISESKLIDFQTIKYGPPCLDVIQLIYTNTRISLRKQHFTELISYYYRKLEDIFSERALQLQDYLPKDQFFESCETFKLQIKLQAVIDRCLTAIPDEIHQKTTSDEEKFYDFIFVNRSKYLVDYYLNIPKYRELVSEDLIELRDMLSNL